MGEQAHTPGPWVRDHFDELRGGDGSLVRFRGMANILAGSDATIVRAKANTRLADAAPDMFEALLSAQKWLAEQTAAPDDLQDAIDAALAKAAPSRSSSVEG